MILSDRPVPTALNVRAYNHVLGSSQMAFFAPNAWAERLAAGFPQTLAEVPVLLPDASSALRRSLDHWFDEIQIAPRVVAEFDDSALMKTFGEAGQGVFPAPGVIAQDIADSCRASLVGTVDEVTETFIAISPQRRLRHPSVLRIAEHARDVLASLSQSV